MSNLNFDAHNAAKKAGYVESATQFLLRYRAYSQAKFAAPERLLEHLKGLVTIEPTYSKDDREFLLNVHAASVPVCDAQDGTLKFTVEGEVFGVPEFVVERLKDCQRVEMTIGNCLGGSGVKEFKDAFGDREVLTTVTGLACSAGAYLAQLGSHRKIVAKGALLLHPRVMTMIGNLHTLKREMKMLQELHEVDAGYLVHRTGQPRVVVESWLSGADVVFSAHKAVEFGLADEII